MQELRKACDAMNPSLPATAQTAQTEEHTIARMFHELISTGTIHTPSYSVVNRPARQW
jgi:hypothetical protein